jgi:CRISPR-associated endoribonuclease Cas6
MRFTLHLKPVRDGQKLLFNYQYPLQSWLYGLISKADNDYASFLHNRGYEVPNSRKTFKHFTFSSLQIKNAKPVRKGDTYIQLRSESLVLLVSFFMDKAAEDFIVGLFQNQAMSLYNREFRADFVVERVETSALPDFANTEGNKTTTTFKTISPMVMAERIGNLDQYLSPADDAFARFFALNLCDRYSSLQGGMSMKMDAFTAQNIVNFRLLSDPSSIKKRGFTVKEGKVNTETKVIGYYNFSFEITAPAEMIEVGFLGGFGKECAMGAGCVEIVK